MLVQWYEVVDCKIRELASLGENSPHTHQHYKIEGTCNMPTPLTACTVEATSQGWSKIKAQCHSDLTKYGSGLSLVDIMSVTPFLFKFGTDIHLNSRRKRLI